MPRNLRSTAREFSDVRCRGQSISRALNLLKNVPVVTLVLVVKESMFRLLAVQLQQNLSKKIWIECIGFFATFLRF